jgi:predicted RNA methylase
VFAKVARPAFVRARTVLAETAFERRYGVDTEGWLTQEELGYANADFNMYKPARLTSLRRILPRKEVTDQDVFLDLGSGKGRVVLQAALHYPFSRVYGVELSEELHRIAERNLEHNRERLAGRDVVLVCADALEYKIPDEVTVVFLYNPFGGEVFETVVDALLESVDRCPRRLRIVYGNPREEAALLRTGRIRRTRARRGWRPNREWSRSNSYHLYEVVPADR